MIDDEDDDDSEIFSHFVFSVKLIRMIDNMLFPSKIRFKMEIIPMGTDDIDKIFNKMKFWIDKVANNSIVFSNINANAIEMFINQTASKPRINNSIILTPEEPNDQHLAVIFQAKMQALAGQNLIFGPVEIRSDNQLGLEFTFVGNANHVLPTMDKWVGERSYFAEPWWNRDDGSSLDVLPTPDADLNDKPSFAFNFDFLDKKSIPFKDVVVRPVFKPVVIDGGKA
jgi:hypothetical protein